jgi:Kef-type K+ transport system membrane component KefB
VLVLATVPIFLFLGAALSITAIPILGRMLIEMGLQHTALGATVIAAAAEDCLICPVNTAG